MGHINEMQAAIALITIILWGLFGWLGIELEWSAKTMKFILTLIPCIGVIIADSFSSISFEGKTRRNDYGAQNNKNRERSN